MMIISRSPGTFISLIVSSESYDDDVKQRCPVTWEELCRNVLRQ